MTGVSLEPFASGQAVEVARDMQHRVRSQRPAEDAYDTDPADIRIACRTNDFGDEESVRIALKGRQRAAVSSCGSRQGVQCRRWKGCGQQMEQLDRADTSRGRHRDYGVEPAT